MTVLSVVQNAATKIGIEVPTVLFSATTRTAVEIQSLINDVALEIARVYDWSLLKTMATFTGTGAASAFNLPSDYDRMVSTASLWSSRYLWAINPINDVDQWLELVTLPYTQITGSWINYGGQIHILDTMALNDTAKFFYVSNQIVQNAGLTYQATFTADTDTFRLDENVLRLGFIWRWKAAKNQPYAEDLQNYEIALKNRIDKDPGGKSIISGRPYGYWRSRNVAWPGTISGTVP